MNESNVYFLLWIQESWGKHFAWTNTGGAGRQMKYKQPAGWQAILLADLSTNRKQVQDTNNE